MYGVPGHQFVFVKLLQRPIYSFANCSEKNYFNDDTSSYRSIPVLLRSDMSSLRGLSSLICPFLLFFILYSPSQTYRPRMSSGDLWQVITRYLAQPRLLAVDQLGGNIISNGPRVCRITSHDTSMMLRTPRAVDRLLRHCSMVLPVF